MKNIFHRLTVGTLYADFFYKRSRGELLMGCFELNNFSGVFLDFIRYEHFDVLTIGTICFWLILKKVPMCRIYGYAKTDIFPFSVFFHPQH